MEGAALSTLINQIIINIYLWQQFRKVSEFSVSLHIKKIIAAAILMGITVLILKHYEINVIIIIATCAAIYFATLALLKESTLKLFRSLFAKT